MPETEAAVVRPGTGTFAWETLRVDEPRPDELLVRIVGVGICHTDLATRDEHLHTPMPAVLGHEGAGVVEAVGSAVTRAKPGDRVLLSFSSCGHCPACLHGHPAYCTTFIPRNFDGARPDGSMPFRDQRGEAVGGRFFGQSSFARRTLVDERSTVPVETADEGELALLAPVGCGIQTGAGAVLNELRPGTGESVAVFGAGAVGLSAVMAAALTSAEKIIAIDIVPSWLELARELGATIRSASAGDSSATVIGEQHGTTASSCRWTTAGRRSASARARSRRTRRVRRRGYSPLSYAAGWRGSYGVGVTTFDRLPACLRTPSPGAVDVLVVAAVGLFTASDAAVNEPGYRQADRFIWLLSVVSLVALLWRRRRPVLVSRKE